MPRKASLPLALGTERTREARARRRAGLVGLRIWVDEAALHDTLVAHRLIRRDMLDSRAAISSAVSRAIENLARIPIIET